jgi:hypothetical protein
MTQANWIAIFNPDDSKGPDGESAFVAGAAQTDGTIGVDVGTDAANNPTVTIHRPAYDADGDGDDDVTASDATVNISSTVDITS